MDFSILINNAEYILIFGGFVAMSWFVQKVIRPVPVVGAPVSLLSKILSFFGFFIGIFLVVTGAAAWKAQATNIAGSLSAGAVYFFFTLPETIFGISSIWFYVAIFLIPAVIVYIVFKFIEDVLKLLGTLLASRPITFIVGAMCIAQGILLILGNNLFTILLNL